MYIYTLVVLLVGRTTGALSLARRRDAICLVVDEWFSRCVILCAGGGVENTITPSPHKEDGRCFGSVHHYAINIQLLLYRRYGT